ncbi:MAG: ABC transporter substrate-binding protein [Candidatus Latescibacteria bacterium]|nr:ABC transporter substrate-binding protein [Candidatus Latescibacterota bacterium]
MRCSSGLFLLLLISPALAHPSPWPVSVTDATGQTITLARPPARIVSLIPSNTEILFALGLGSSVVGVTERCDYPPEARRKPSMGGLTTMSVETIVAARPDLVLATRDDPADLIAGLRAVGLPVVVLDPQTVEDIFSAIRTIGTLTGQEAAVDALIRSLRQRLDAVAAKVRRVPATQRPAVFIGNPDETAHWTPGPGTFTTDIIERAGGRNVADDLRRKTWGVYSLEQIVVKNPDVIITTNSPDESPDRVSQRAQQAANDLTGWRETKAGRARRVYAVPAEHLLRPGPRAISGVEDLARCFYPDLFPQTSAPSGRADRR